MGVQKIKIFGEMPEMAEGARLEIVCSAKSGTEGSNPSLSARKIYKQDADKCRFSKSAEKKLLLKHFNQRLSALACVPNSL